jgi:hypothetical protein
MNIFASVLIDSHEFQLVLGRSGFENFPPTVVVRSSHGSSLVKSLFVEFVSRMFWHDEFVEIEALVNPSTSNHTPSPSAIKTFLK